MRKSKLGYQIGSSAADRAGSTAIPEAPDHVFCDESLDATLGRLKEALRTWIKAGPTYDDRSSQLRHFSIHILGPLPAEVCVPDRRTPEQKLAEATSPSERFYALPDAAESRFEAGDYESARAHIQELQRRLPRYKKNFAYPPAAETVHVVLGRVAIKEGDVEEAKRRLVEQGRIEVSPDRPNFQPKMSLARDLLEAGERQAVLDYFKACRKFWSTPEELDIWTMYVNAGRMPDF